MIKYNNKNIELMNHNDNLVNKVMYMDSVAYERMDGESGYTPTPPSEPKFYATYSDGKTHTIECDGNSTLVNRDVKPYEHEYDFLKMVTAVIGDCVDTIGGSSLYQCSGLTSVTIPTSVVKFEPHSMVGMKSLTHLDIPSSVSYVGNYALSACESLTGLTFSNSLTFIGDGALSLCSGLNYVIFESIVPPETNGQPLNTHGNAYPIYVPDNSIELYRTATGWKRYYSRYRPLSEYQG